MTTLKLDWCSHEAAKYAVEHWHYSRSMPAGKAVHVGAWEDSRYIGTVLFGWGANMNIGRPFGLDQIAVCELTRVALTTHVSPVSRIVAQAVKMLRKQSPGVRLIVSYADPNEGHHGGVYQAMNWVYVGKSSGAKKIIVNGKATHRKTVAAKYGVSGSTVGAYVYTEQKHKYLMPLDDAMRKQIASLAKPYPKRVTRGTGEIDNAPQSNGETGGAGPTVPLL